jgi:hypothetical protein
VSKPKKLTLAEVAKRVNRERPGAWSKLSPAERRQLAAMLNEAAANEAAEMALERQRAADRRRQAKAVDRFMDQFWAPVRVEQRAAARKAKR